MSYTDYQNQPSSEKITLAVLHASKRLMGWSVHSGSIYKLTNFDVQSIVSIEDSGTAYSEVSSLGGIVTSSFYNDRNNKILYIKTTGSDNPNGRFLVLTQRLFFSNVPIVLPYDLGSGFEVFWEPQIKSTSQFGVEIDTINQTSEAIEGSGSLVLHNDQDFWPANFDKLTFENKTCLIYSYNRDLTVDQAKLIFRGTVEKRTYKTDSITFNLKDLLSELRSPIPLTRISSLGMRNLHNLDLAKQRMIFGRVYGYLPVNIDEVLSGYPVSGTVNVTSSSDTVTGSGTQFLKELSPDDTISINGVNYTVATVDSDTSITLSEAFNENTASGLFITVTPDKPKRWINRKWKVAGHALKQPVTTTGTGSTVTKLAVASTVDFKDGDTIYVGTLGSGEVATVSSVQNSTILKLATSLNTVPSSGVQVMRPAIQNVRINEVPLIYYRDYTFDADTALLILRETAESNASEIRQLSTNLTFTNGSRIVTGSGLDAIFQPGYMVGVEGNASFFEVLAVDQGQLTLRTPSTFTSTATGKYKPLIFGTGDVLSCDVLGRTLDGTSSGTFIKSGPRMIRTLLEDMGLSGNVDASSFDEAEIDASQELGLAIPETYNDTKDYNYRDVINKISKSINGSLVQTQAFNLSYFIIKPEKISSTLKLSESDILNFSVDSTAENIVKTIVVNYQSREYDYLTGTSSIRTQQKTSDSSTYIIKTDRTRTIDTKLVNQSDAEIYANRWSTLLEASAGSIKIETKLQAALVEVGDVIDVSDRKLFVRFGGSDSRRLLLVEKVMKSGSKVTIEAVDLSNCFNRTANITSSTTDFIAATSDQKIYGGFITDQYGMINNDPETFGMNRIF